MSIDLVVVNYKTPGDLHACLRSLDRHPPKTSEATLTVVDVDVPEAYERPFEWAGGEAVTVGVEGNIGYARACNLAARRGSNPVIAFFNADIEVTAGSIDSCRRALCAEPSWGALGPFQVDHSGRIRHAGIFGTLARPVHRGWLEGNTGTLYRDIRKAVTVSGSAYFAKRAMWDELTECPIYRDFTGAAEGAFLPTPHYYEETWASYHAQAHGWDVIYYGQALIIHKWHRASPVNGWAEQQMPISRQIFRRACDAHAIAHD